MNFIIIILGLFFLTHNASAQTCSRIGDTFYCDSKEGSTVISPLGKDRGVIMRPRGELDTYSTMPSGKSSSQIYIDPERDSTPSYRERSYSEPETRSGSRSRYSYETDEYGLPK